MSYLDMTLAAALAENGHAVLRLDAETIRLWQWLVSAIRSVPVQTREGFTFYEGTDGFLSQGREYSAHPSRPDLCDRFCYWHSRRNVHTNYPFAQHEFYRNVQRYEEKMYTLASSLQAMLGRLYGRDEAPNLRDESYLQICDYSPVDRDLRREYLQDPHEDGHLFTIAKPSGPGLVILDAGGEKRAIELGPDQAIAMAGSLLEALTDGEITPAVHGVDASLTGSASRTSVLYFANPSSQERHSWRKGQPLDLQQSMRDRHAAFGNAPVAS